MTELSSALQRHMRENNLTLRDLEEMTGEPGRRISRASLSEIINNPQRKPRIDTLVSIAKILSLPLWRVIQMAGYDLGLSDSTVDQARQLASLAAHQEDVRALLDLLLRSDPKDRRAVLNYLAIRTHEAAEE